MMTKLEQLSELLVSEISQFEKTVELLKKIQAENIGVDISGLENLFKQNQMYLDDIVANHIKEMKNLGGNLQKSKTYPLWALILFITSLLTNVILTYTLFLKI
ncbi:DUF6730 family protein [uncultured Christiangramia sp.]|uniref:DUF6730 family protein n=1 Tax=Christiangramia sp. 3-2217-3z TaxID=3417564 RepID=UPI00261D31CF|nr:DUF6730 family protein [uncultured Christiangramia sp.]|tara:strand:- start:139 stop:447 length:309 start_codon:yes stop_codon:yes gene_type:complete